MNTYSIQQTETGWLVLNAAGEQVGDAHETYDLALGVIAAQLANLVPTTGDEDDADETPDGLLPERWTSTTGVAFSERLEGGRDFSECTWTWRDPEVYPLPLMHQTETDMGHFGAVVAGFADQWELHGGTVYASGRFYSTEQGEALRDMMLAGRRVGVSVDPTEAVEAEFRCTDFDDDGWCNEGDTVFLAYECGGLTATPFPGFPNATVELEAADAGTSATAGDVAPPPAVAASSGRRSWIGAPVEPPRAWFDMEEPELGSDLLVMQDDGGLAVPLTITDDGQVFGNVARDGQCHIGYEGVCVTPPQNVRLSAFRGGLVRCEDGTDAITGPLIASADHPVLTMRAPEARDAYAHSAVAWADVTMSNGKFGTQWFAGSLRPDVTELQLRVLRASQISGDWREDANYGELDLIAALVVSVPGFGITRQAIAASGLVASAAAPMPRVLTRNGRVVAMVSVGMVSPCPECRRRAMAASAAVADRDHLGADLRELLEISRKLERRTRTMIPDAIAAAGARVVR